MKKTFKTIFFLSLSVTILLFVVVAISAFSAMNAQSASIGIIGGADGPTAIFLTETLFFTNPVFTALVLSIAVCIVSAIVWAVSKKKG